MSRQIFICNLHYNISDIKRVDDDITDIRCYLDPKRLSSYIQDLYLFFFAVCCFLSLFLNANFVVKIMCCMMRDITIM